MHASQLLADPSALSRYHLCAIPGGFSFGDEIASGKVLAVKLMERLKEALYQFVEEERLLMGICNGFQVLVQMGLLPHSQSGKPRVVSLMHNKGKKFINRWVTLDVTENTGTPFFIGLNSFDLPIRHGEGRLALASSGKDSEEGKASEQELVKQRAPLRYADDVNGSFDRIAALNNERGNVLGIMPHPEAFVRWSQHPQWTARKFAPDAGDGFGEGEAPGLRIFKNAHLWLARQ
jgi:phosphoribosylformylglycinamidine synthase